MKRPAPPAVPQPGVATMRARRLRLCVKEKRRDAEPKLGAARPRRPTPLRAARHCGSEGRRSAPRARSADENTARVCCRHHDHAPGFFQTPRGSTAVTAKSSVTCTAIPSVSQSDAATTIGPEAPAM